MLRFLALLFNKDYEPCKSCETLREQLYQSNLERDKLTNTLISLIKDTHERDELLDTVTSLIKPRINKVEGDAPKVLVPSSATTWSRRRAIAEQSERLRAQTIENSKNLGRRDNDAKKEDTPAQSEATAEASTTITPVSISELEEELGVNEDAR